MRRPVGAQKGEKRDISNVKMSLSDGKHSLNPGVFRALQLGLRKVKLRL
ncbi:MAG: hypothetical protein IPI60_03110 [Saprospiraceae bacterium]|nr:hypothetical protein [Saprospiraceae bacterium]